MLPKPARKPGFLLLSFTILFFSACTPTERSRSFDSAQVSLDFAKTKEKGNSSVDWDPKTGENVVTYHEYRPIGLGAINERDLEDLPSASASAAGWLAFRAGFGFVAKGLKAKEGDGKLSLNYLEVPIQGIYRYPLAKGSAAEGNAFAGFGPYFAYGIGGKAKGGGFQESSFGDGSDNAGYKRFDAGLAFTLGYKLNKGFSLDLGYDLGLANNITAGQDVKSHNRCFSINLGYEISRLYRK